MTNYEKKIHPTVNSTLEKLSQKKDKLLHENKHNKALKVMEDIKLQLESGVFQNPEDFYQGIKQGLKMELPLAKKAIDRAVAILAGPEKKEHILKIMKVVFDRLEELCKTNDVNNTYKNITAEFAGQKERGLDIDMTRTEEMPYSRQIEDYKPDLETILTHRLIIGLMKILSKEKSLSSNEFPALQEKIAELSDTIKDLYPNASELLKLISDKNRTEPIKFTKIVRIKTRMPSLYSAIFPLLHYSKSVPGLSKVIDNIFQATKDIPESFLIFQKKRELVELGLPTDT